ncbi:carboxypeptidase M32 [Collibacillus ludicampi]|uniref:Metal-dependent carboxypeptidase n=1 Tax=Collibacillus ludicampi TaxID=2771369 RepID=A0AAV4LG17_9BACL|nr:carboxypeptidase M32 [Collibacillus ludicampi]GIM46691.1 carboxypeptidase M32 [Collibacillus ludicampi]
MKSLETLVNEFKEYVKKMVHYNEALSLMFWDLRTGAPKKGVAARAEAIGTLSTEVFKMATSPQMEEYLTALSEPGVYEQLDRITRGIVRECKKEFDRSKKIPQDRYQEYVVLTSQAESVWEEAKHTSDFAMFQPYLEKIVAMNIEFIGYWGYKEHKYDTLLDQYEPGMTVKKLDAIFGELRRNTVDLVQAIVHSSTSKPDVQPFLKFYDPLKQREFSRYILEKMGYDFQAGRLDETVHPFEITLNQGDVRVTTKFDPHDLRSALFSTIHEGGHALYEQNVSPELAGTPLSSGTSMGIHESQSRFWENIIGRSYEFWQCFYRDLVRAFPAQLSDVSLDAFYRGINVVEPSLIRIEADEVTYNLHIMIRYEIEKGLIQGDIRVADLPEIWADKMKDYLGIVPKNDAEGVLQDVHWSGGSFGYFPSYSLGNIYAAQFTHALEKEMPDFKERIKNGDLRSIKEWLSEKIHKHGKLLTPSEIIQAVTGEEINATYLVRYLENKFKPLYHLN